MELQSNRVEIKADRENIKDFLLNPSNVWFLLPQDKVSDFQSNNLGCSFKVQGGITISLLNNGVTDDSILLKSGERTPFPFDLTINLLKTEFGTEGNIAFKGEVNMFLKMMVEKPLLSLFNYMSEKLKDQFEK